MMAVKLRHNVLAAYFFIAISLLATITPALAYSIENQQGYGGSRAYSNVKAANNNLIKKKIMLESKTPSQPVRPVKVQKQDDGFNFGKIFGVVVDILSGASSNDVASDKSGEFSWTKLVSLGLQMILRFFGAENSVIEKMDPGSPIEALITAGIAYFTGSQDTNEVSVMAKQATELWDILISLLDALKTSFTQRSFEARSLGSNDLLADAAIASITMTKSYLQSQNTVDDLCIQKFICEANRDCADETSDSGYLFCQVGSGGLSYLLEKYSYTPFEILNDAGRRGRIGEDCSVIFKECEK